MIYFITLCGAGRKCVLANDEVFSALENAARRLGHWQLLAAVLMPDHLHAIVTPTEDRGANLSNCSAALKRWIRQELSAPWAWQPGCFDRLLRSDESVQHKWLYVRNNPVRAGLVRNWEDWPYRIGFEDETG